jgi:hypothetical protein
MLHTKRSLSTRFVFPFACAAVAALIVAGCSGDDSNGDNDSGAPDASHDSHTGTDAKTGTDTGTDTGSLEDAGTDTSTADTGTGADASDGSVAVDASDSGADAHDSATGVDASDGAVVDAGIDVNIPDTGIDAAIPDAGLDTGIDAAIPDAGLDTGLADAADASDPQLNAYWKLDETNGAVTVADSSGKGNAGVPVGVTWVTGRSGNAASFDGATSVITVSNSASLDPSAITIAAWINPTAWGAGNNRRILQKGNGDNQYRLLDEGDQLKFEIFGANNTTVTITAPLPATGTWSHVAGTYDGATARLYVGGAQVASAPATIAMPTTTDPLCIGNKCASTAPGDHFNGLLDEVRLYGRALSAGEITTLAQ